MLTAQRFLCFKASINYMWKDWRLEKKKRLFIFNYQRLSTSLTTKTIFSTFYFHFTKNLEEAEKFFYVAWSAIWPIWAQRVTIGFLFVAFRQQRDEAFKKTSSATFELEKKTKLHRKAASASRLLFRLTEVFARWRGTFTYR